MNSLDSVAKVYTDHRRELMQLMQDHGVAFTAEPTHGQVLKALYRSIKYDPDFRRDLDIMIASEGYNYPAGVIIGQISEAVGATVGGIADVWSSKVDKEAQEEKFFQDYVLNKQRGSRATWWIVGGSLLLVGVAFIFILRK